MAVQAATADRLVRVWANRKDGNFDRMTLSAAAIMDITARQRSLESVGVFMPLRLETAYTDEAGPRPLSGALAGSVIFYLVTNTESWLRDPAYMKSLSGWWQAMTVGRPEFMPTLFFFRNTFVSDLFFTAAFAVTMEYAALRSGRESLFARRVTA